MPQGRNNASEASTPGKALAIGAAKAATSSAAKATTTSAAKAATSGSVEAGPPKAASQWR